LHDAEQRCIPAQASTAKRKKDLRPSDARRVAAKMARTTEALLLVLNVLNLLFTLLVPSAVVELTHAEPVPGFVVVACAVILWMKLVSYAHCNHELRCGRGRIPLHLGNMLLLWGLCSALWQSCARSMLRMKLGCSTLHSQAQVGIIDTDQ
jgi:hypothetical protein